MSKYHFTPAELTRLGRAIQLFNLNDQESWFAVPREIESQAHELVIRYAYGADDWDTVARCAADISAEISLLGHASPVRADISLR